MTQFLFAIKCSGLPSAFLEACFIAFLPDCCSGAPGMVLSGSIFVSTLSKLKRAFSLKRAGFANEVTFSYLILAVTREKQYSAGCL